MKSILNDPVIALLIFSCFLSTTLCAQAKTPRDKYITGGFNLGYLGAAPYNTSNAEGMNLLHHFGAIGADNGRHQFALTGTSSIGVNAGFLWQNKKNKNMNSFNVSFQNNRNSYPFQLPFRNEKIIGNDNDADDTISKSGTWVENDKYLAYAISLQHFQYARNHSLLKGEGYRYVKFSLGQSFCHRNGYSGIIKPGQQDIGFDDMGNMTKAVTVSANPVSTVLGGELGLRSFSPDKDRSIDIGFAWYVPFNNSYTRDFTFYQNIVAPKGQPGGLQQKGSEEIKFIGSSIMLNVTYNFNAHIERRPPDTTKFSAPPPLPPPPVAIHEHRPHHLLGRKVRMQEKLNVSDSLVTLSVWDKGIVDGDRISLYLNDKEILHDYTVGRKKREIVLHLVPGKNYLVMHALNLGRIPPNTAAMEINDGERTQEITLNSDLGKSGAVELFCKLPQVFP